MVHDVRFIDVSIPRLGATGGRIRNLTDDEILLVLYGRTLKLVVTWRTMLYKTNLHTKRSQLINTRTKSSYLYPEVKLFLLLRNFKTFPSLLIELELVVIVRRDCIQNIFDPLCLYGDLSESSAALGVVRCVHNLQPARLRVDLEAIIVPFEPFGCLFVLTRR